MDDNYKYIIGITLQITVFRIINNGIDNMYTDQWISFINKYRLINLYQLYIYKINGMTTPYYINTYLLIVSYIITNIIGYDWVILISIIRCNNNSIIG